MEIIIDTNNLYDTADSFADENLSLESSCTVDCGCLGNCELGW